MKMATRNDLSLERQVEVIEYRKKNPTLGNRKIAEFFKVLTYTNPEYHQEQGDYFE